MAAAKPEIFLYQHRDELATKFQLLYHVVWRVPDSTMLHASSTEVVFCFKTKMAAGKQELLPFSMVHYQPAVTC